MGLGAMGGLTAFDRILGKQGGEAAPADDVEDAGGEAGADTIGIGDAVASQVSPRLYETLIQPREKQLVTALKESGAIP